MSKTIEQNLRQILSFVERMSYGSFGQKGHLILNDATPTANEKFVVLQCLKDSVTISYTVKGINNFSEDYTGVVLNIGDLIFGQEFVDVTVTDGDGDLLCYIK